MTNGDLLPVRAAAALYRGKLLAAIEQGLRTGTLQRPASMTALACARTLQALYKKNWNVCLKERYRHGQGVMKYLSGYVKGGPLGDTRLRAADDAAVAFAYRDHRDGRHKTLRLLTEDFLSRLLWHVPPPRQHTIRHYGLYSAHSAAKRERAQQALGQAASERPDPSWQAALIRLGRAERAHCPRCGNRLVRGIAVARVRAGDQISIVKVVPAGLPNQGAQADTPNVLSLPVTDPPHASDIFLCGGVRLS